MVFSYWRPFNPKRRATCNYTISTTLRNQMMPIPKPERDPDDEDEPDDNTPPKPEEP